MKYFNVTGLIFILFFLVLGVTYAQSSAEECYDKGVEYAVQGEFPEAKEEFEKALKVDPFYKPAERNLETIKDVIEQKIKRETAIHLIKGVSYANKYQYDRAISDYTKALEINPEYAKTYNNRGLVYVNKGQYDQAISDFTNAIEINPKFDEAYNNRGFTYFVNLENKVKGCADFKKACELGNCKNYNMVKQSGDCP